MTARPNPRSKVTKFFLKGPEQLGFDLQGPPPTLKQLWTPDDIYARIDTDLLAQFLEDRRVERKSARVQANDLGEYFSMWSNTPPDGGLIIVGVEDNGSVSGCLRMDRQHKNRLEAINVHCEDAKVRSKEVKVKNSRGEDDYIIVFRVLYHPDKLVVTSANKAFHRQGEDKIEIKDDLKREMRITKGEIHHEEELVPLDYPEDFDLDEVKKFCALFYKSKRLKQSRSDEELLHLAKLGKKTIGGFRPNLAGALLLAKDPRSIIPAARIRLIRYEGVSEKTGENLNVVFSEFIDGPIPKLIDAAKDRIASQLRSFQKLTSTGRLEKRSEYPEAAWLEAMVNAIAHRSYNLRNSPIFIKLFDDRMVVESPGGFVPPTTPDTIYDSHSARNQNLMEAMLHLDFTFMGNEGTRRMRDAMLAAQLPEPKFAQGGGSVFKVVVVLENDVKSRQTSGIEFGGLSEEDYSALTREERYIINHLSENASIIVSQAALLIERSEPTASKILQNLVKRGILNPFVEGRPEHARPRTYSLKKPT